jgi:DNA (cytosine-5)-methyltransferase 1
VSLTFATVCSGIGAPEVAWHPLGWTPVFCSEIEPFPSAVLKHHYPGTPNLGDFTTVGDEYAGRVDVLCGGTPCQAFSVAGKRAGLDDPRGNLAIEFLRLARRTRAKWLVWENVPGVLHSNKGRDFGAFLGLLGECGYKWGYRVLDAQYFGVPQTRRRVFVVGHLGDWRCAASVLFERHCLGWIGENDVSELSRSRISTAFDTRMSESTRRAIQSRHTIRNLTPKEYERAQGFPDDYTAIPFRNKPATDGPRYKALGNSMAVPVMHWIGRRIQAVEQLLATPQTQDERRRG